MINELELKKLIQDDLKGYFQEIDDTCKWLFREAIIRSVYNAYSPSFYPPTEQLKDNVKTEIRNDGLYIYVDTNSMKYRSAVGDKRIVTSAVPWFVQQGHMAKHTELNENQYNNYEGRKYLEMAKELIDKRFGLDVEIINERPSWV